MVRIVKSGNFASFIEYFLDCGRIAYDLVGWECFYFCRVRFRSRHKQLVRDSIDQMLAAFTGRKLNNLEDNVDI